MSDDPVEQALAELQDLVRCRCHPAYTGRGLRDPDCECDSAEAVTIVADRIKAQAAEIERQHGIWRIKPEPVKQVRWGNDYEDKPPFWWYLARASADKAACKNRIAVIRREIVDGVVSYYKEDV